jgi:hypothetical protein
MPEPTDGEDNLNQRLRILIAAMKQDGTEVQPSDFTAGAKAVIAALSKVEFEALLSMRHKFTDKEALKKFDGSICIIL